MLRKLSSRKFQVAIGAAMVAIGTALQGLTTWEQAVTALVGIVFSYNLGEGLADNGRNRT